MRIKTHFSMGTQACLLAPGMEAKSSRHPHLHRQHEGASSLLPGRLGAGMRSQTFSSQGPWPLPSMVEAALVLLAGSHAPPVVTTKSRPGWKATLVTPPLHTGEQAGGQASVACVGLDGAHTPARLGQRLRCFPLHLMLVLRNARVQVSVPTQTLPLLCGSSTLVFREQVTLHCCSASGRACAFWASRTCAAHPPLCSG